MTENLEKNVESETSDKQEDEAVSNEKSIEEKLAELEDRLLRSLAEIENQRKRFEKEVKDAFEFGGFNFAKETLSILDNLQRAKISIKNDDVLKANKDLDKFLKNIDIIEKDLVSIFEKNKIIRIKSINENFDPNLHQAMLEIEDDDVEPGIIKQEMQPGYMFGNRLLRPSFVGISKKKSHKQEEKDEKNNSERLAETKKTPI
jgi:molecular chaperone GrpE|tara:strand:- start:287 stop:895 length:609 start_codon:yes stop_codon:yes gene_type:complete